MKELIEKLKSVVVDLEKEHGSILVFALFLREESLGGWDIVISATWLKFDDLNSYKVIASKVQEKLSNQEQLEIARVELLDPHDPVVSFLGESYPVQNGGKEIQNCESFSKKFKFAIKRAYMIRCRKMPEDGGREKLSSPN